MENLDATFLEELREAFREEAAEHLQTMVTGMLSIEQQGDDPPLASTIENVYRAAHSLKGASRAADMPRVGDLCQILETIFSTVKAGTRVILPREFDALHAAVETIQGMIAAPDAIVETQVAETQAALSAVAAAEKVPPSPVYAKTPDGEPRSASPAVGESTVRMGTDRITALLLQAEQLLSVKLATHARVSEMRQVVERFERWKREWLRAEKRMPALPEAFRHRHRQHLQALDAGLHDIARAMQADQHHVSTQVDELLEGTKHMLMLPISSILKPYPRMVRDIARSQDKQVVLVIEGESIAIDKRILEQLVDPLTHLLRNCIDHGIETPDERQRQAKPPQATIHLTITQAGRHHVQVRVADDGRGIALDAVVRESVAKGMVTPDMADKLDRHESLALLFRSGLSTRETVTRLSGRGLGLAIVRDNVERLGGTVEVETVAGQGAAFILQFPVTVSTFRAVVVRCDGSLFAMPTLTVERVLRVPRAELASARGSVSWDGKRVPVRRLAPVLSLSGTRDRDPDLSDPVIVVILAGGGVPRAFVVDAVIGEQEVLLKDVSSRITGIPLLTGATILASGDVVPILDAAALALAADRLPTGEALASVAAVRRRKTLLVVEDSITSRLLLKHLLVGAGYDVQTAVDGAAGLAHLRRQPVDLVLSDIEMPRMDGLELTRRIRADTDLARVPVVLVTTLEAPEDEERGMAAGANAYIVKSRFERDSLLAAVSRCLGASA